MISYQTKSDIFQANVEAIVNPVNCVGVMGAGLALAFKQRFPENFKQYQQACKTQVLKIGKCFVCKDGSQYIINFPTKNHWKQPSQYKFIEKGLVDLIQIVQEKGIKSIAIPALGAGLGGLDWVIVKNMIETAFKDSDVEVVVYNPLT